MRKLAQFLPKYAAFAQEAGKPAASAILHRSMKIGLSKRPAHT
jgi:hypothetical protein